MGEPAALAAPDQGGAQGIAGGTRPRFVVTTIEGDLTPRGGTTKSRYNNMSAHVIDTAWNRRVVATYRTEEFFTGRRFGRSQYATMREAREAIIEAAQADADRRNARAAAR